MPRQLPATALDYHELTRKRLPRFLSDYIDGAAGDELTLASNRYDLSAIRIQQRVLRDVSAIDTGTTLAGQDASMPLALAPVGLAGMAAKRGEAQAARVAAEIGLPFTLSTVGICSPEEVYAASSTPPWFQLYMLRDRNVVEALLDRAWEIGYRTLVFTVDLPLPGMRHRDTRNGLGAEGLTGVLMRLRQVLARPGWLLDVPIGGKPLSFGSLESHLPHASNIDAFKEWVDTQFDPGVTWEDIDWLRGRWKGRLLLKGILSAEDAKLAVATGADGLVVSNHGGRQLDAAPSTISVLPAIAEAVGNQTTLLMDGGVRSGADIFKGLALGADGVLIGRPWVWALAGGGSKGLTALLNTLQHELLLTMTLAGVTSIDAINATHLVS